MSHCSVKHARQYGCRSVRDAPLFIDLAISDRVVSHDSFVFYRKIVELEEELRVVGNNLKSLEVSEEKVMNLFYLQASFTITSHCASRTRLTIRQF